MIIDRNSFDIKKIKLIIWDLDNTFWKGTLSEGGCSPDSRHIALVIELAKRGIISSICSKNNFEACKTKLETMQVWDYFVFPSINWDEKGLRVDGIIKDMKLRQENTLFLDDEKANLERVSAFCPNVMCASIDELCDVISAQMAELRLDESLKRLRQYHELEKKTEAQKSFESNDDFLREAKVQVEMCEDCLAELDRIQELISRTNQLNYTKARLSEDQTKQLLQNSSVRCGYVRCRDKFSDYGIVGFYAVDRRENRLIHFLFSCRTIGMGVEQYVYAHLLFPELLVVGEVVTQLKKNGCPS